MIRGGGWCQGSRDISVPFRVSEQSDKDWNFITFPGLLIIVTMPVTPLVGNWGYGCREILHNLFPSSPCDMVELHDAPHHYQSRYHLPSHLHWYLQSRSATADLQKIICQNVGWSFMRSISVYLGVKYIFCIFKHSKNVKKTGPGRLELLFPNVFPEVPRWLLYGSCLCCLRTVSEIFKVKAGLTDKWILSWQLIIGFQKILVVKDDFKRGLMQDD